jgi:hypothetical protein
MFRSVALLSAVVVSFSAGLAFAANSINFQNLSDWAIHELYLSPSKAEKWGPDQLTDKVINNGESFELSGIPVGKYDLKIVDEEGDECVVAGVKIADSETVVINNEILVGCQKATAESAEDEETEE